MLGPLVLVFLVVPFVELYVIFQLGHAIGFGNTIAVMIIVSLVGAWLVKREGISTLRKAQRELDAGRLPGKQVVDGLLILLAGGLLLTPGFVTDVVGILLLLPPVRALLRRGVSKRMSTRIITVQSRPTPPHPPDWPEIDHQ